MKHRIMFKSFATRAESHAYLEKILADGKHPQAECREDPNAPEPYQVWSGPDREE